MISRLVVAPSPRGLHPRLSSIDGLDIWLVRVPRAHISNTMRRKERTMRRRMRRRRVWYSRPHHHPRAKQSKIHQVKDEGSSFGEEDDEKMALFVKRFGKFLVKKGYRARRKKCSSKNKEESRKCFNCGSKDHLVAQCPYNSDNSDDNKKNKKKDKMAFKKKNKGGSYVVTWDSDASSSNDDDSDDDKTTKKKTLASIAINKKPSLFDTLLCFMAKATKV